ncbi:hypothetical protein GP5015_2167 [gamma proteobacterium HTCC5015]|nr:hypothetical protein GP5015_2167 [gamma proteobacterium HTCC5015]
MFTSLGDALCGTAQNSLKIQNLSKDKQRLAREKSDYTGKEAHLADKKGFEAVKNHVF